MVEQKSLSNNSDAVISEINVARILYQARVQQAAIKQLSKNGIALSRSEAYAVQEAGITMRVKDNERLVGLKMGLTSEGKRKQMNLDSPLYGELTDKMQIDNNSNLDISKLIHPKIEPEIAFLISKPLAGNVTQQQVLEACSGVSACMEILDSRYEQFKYFSMEDVIADNSSSSHFVAGPWISDFKHIDLKNLNMKMAIDGQIVQKGQSSEISGDPVNSVIELCRLLAERGRILEAGMIVLAGAATAAVELKSKQKITLQVDSLPIVQISIL
ncbi:MAG: fumarylacetoacetate hydrolase family protein [Bdellovibrionaceae bacterium]|nr:fumarylacetoacetate hydrolase family protein [Bdellovibrio sp.]